MRQAFTYVKKRIEKTTALSDLILDFINLEKGSFFTLLPEGSNIHRLYEFEAGVILPQNPDVEYGLEGKKSTYSLIPTIRKNLSAGIMEKLKEDTELSCVFDDVLRKKKISNADSNEIIHYYNDEIYYVINKSNASEEKIENSFNKSGSSFWHSLAVLTRVNILNINNNMLSLNDLEKIALNTELFMVGAYDSESYIFWEK